MKHLIVGVLASLLGLVGLIAWWKTFGLVMRGVVPFTLLMVGIVAGLSGLRRIADGRANVEEQSGEARTENN